MKLSYIISESVSNVFRNKMRTALTMLGLIIGISSVIVLVGMGDGSNREVSEKIRALGGDIITASVFESGLTYSEALDMEKLPGIDKVAPEKTFTAEPTKGKLKAAGATTHACDENYLETRNLELQKGRNLNAVDRENKSKVCILGSSVAKNLFPGEDPVGKTVKLGGDEFSVVGVLKSQGQSMGLNTENLVLVPFTTAIDMGAGTTINDVYVKASDSENAASAKESVQTYLSSTLGKKQNSYSVNTQSELVEATGSVNKTMTVLLGGIAGISLIVAGIGVMNVMLVSVAERVREIGIKKALGARGKDIMLQFLSEALIISLMGGAIGVACGLGFGALVAGAGMPFVPSAAIVLIAAGTSVAIGLVFGIIPSYRASKLNPIEALR